MLAAILLILSAVGEVPVGLAPAKPPDGCIVLPTASWLCMLSWNAVRASTSGIDSLPWSVRQRVTYTSLMSMVTPLLLPWNQVNPMSFLSENAPGSGSLPLLDGYRLITLSRGVSTK